MRIILMLFLSVFLVVGIIVTRYGIKEYIKSKQPVNWRTVTGTIRDSYEIRSQNSSVAPVVIYSYSVDGNEYVSKSRLTASTLSSEEREQLFAKNQNILIHFEANNPQNAHTDYDKAEYLKNEKSFSTVMIWGGLAFILFPLVILFSLICTNNWRAIG